MKDFNNLYSHNSYFVYQPISYFLLIKKGEEEILLLVDRRNINGLIYQFFTKWTYKI